MKATVKTQFTDTEKQQTFSVNSEWSGTKTRFEEINKKGQDRYKKDFLTSIEETEPEKKAPAKQTETKELKVNTETKA